MNNPNKNYAIFLGNLSYETTDAELCELAALYGKTSGCNIPKGPDGGGRGFAFVYPNSLADRDCILLALDVWGPQVRASEVVHSDLQVRIACTTRNI